MCSSNCCFLTCIQVSQEAGQVVCYSHLLQNFPQFIVIHTVKGFGIVNKAEIDVFLELSCFFDDFLLLYSKFQVLLCSVAAGRIHTQVSNPRCPQNPSPHSPIFTAVKPKRSPDTTKCPFGGKITSSWGPLLWTIEIKSLPPQGLRNAPQWVWPHCMSTVNTHLWPSLWTSDTALSWVTCPESRTRNNSFIPSLSLKSPSFSILTFN